MKIFFTESAEPKKKKKRTKDRVAFFLLNPIDVDDEVDDDGRFDLDPPISRRRPTQTQKKNEKDHRMFPFSLDFFRINLVLPSFTGFIRFNRVITGFYWVLRVFLPSFTKFWPSLNGF